MSLIVLYVTCCNKKEAQKIATHLLKKKLIACANMFPIKSRYWWKGKLVYESEVVLLLKTTPKNAVLVKKEITKIHSYTIPCILEFQAKANDAFGRWVEQQLS